MTVMAVIANDATSNGRLIAFVTHLILLTDPETVWPREQRSCVAGDIAQLETAIYNLYNVALVEQERDSRPSHPSWSTSVNAWFDLFERPATSAFAARITPTFAAGTAQAVLYGIAESDALDRWGSTTTEARHKLVRLSEPLPRTIHAILARTATHRCPQDIDVQDASWTLIDEVFWLVGRLEAQSAATKIFETLRTDRTIGSDTELFEAVDVAVRLATITS